MSHPYDAEDIEKMERWNLEFDLKTSKLEAVNLRRAINYWSYCTYEGIQRLCPEKKQQYLDTLKKFGINYP